MSLHCTNGWVRGLMVAAVAALAFALLAACRSEPSPVPAETAAPTSAARQTARPEPTAMSTAPPIAVALAPNLPDRYAAPLRAAMGDLQSSPLKCGARLAASEQEASLATARLRLVPLSEASQPLAERFYAVVAPFRTLTDNIGWDDLRERWTGASGVGMLYLTQDAADDLAAVFGDRRLAEIVPAGEMLARLEADEHAIGLIPFDQLDPTFKVLAVEGVQVLNNRLDAATYPLAVALVAEGPDGDRVAGCLADAIQPHTNRDPHRMTTLIMTGVTAMSRVTALRMEQKGYTYPAEVISATLRAADITHVSNEVPFVEGCRVNTTKNNIVLCSDTTYWAALEAIGTDIVGLSGNHVNDFGREGARQSLAFYAERGIPVYGSGLNVEEACAPLLWEHNGNTFAFIAALAWWPEEAYATDTEPGACYYYGNKDSILQTVRNLSHEADIVSVELQYYETYEPHPTEQQVVDFRELREAGADIVTGVQSHVPQAMETYGAGDPGGPGIIVYGLGNLFFDQMWSWETRTELYARHAVYDGRLASTEILTGVLEDFAQPRWATPEERAWILKSIFDAAPDR